MVDKVRWKESSKKQETAENQNNNNSIIGSSIYVQYIYIPVVQPTE